MRFLVVLVLSIVFAAACLGQSIGWAKDAFEQLSATQPALVAVVLSALIPLGVAVASIFLAYKAAIFTLLRL